MVLFCKQHTSSVIAGHDINRGELISINSLTTKPLGLSNALFQRCD